MKRTASALLAAMALCACTGAARSAPAPQPVGGDWRMAAEEDSATLTWQAGAARSLAFECHGGQDPNLGLMAWQPMTAAVPPTDKPEEIALTSGRERQTYPTLTQSNGGLWEQMGHARKNDPVITAFRRTGSLQMLERGNYAATLASSPGNTAVADFFNWCH